jgi:hypothetical protein
VGGILPERALATQFSDLRDADEIKGRFELMVDETEWMTVLYELSRDRYEAAGKDPNNPSRVPLLRISPNGGQLVISPVKTFGGENFLKPKYDQLETITLERRTFALDAEFDSHRPQTPDDVAALLDELPSGFVKDPEFGLGLQKDYRYIVDTVEAVPGVKHLVISQTRETAINGDTFFLAFKQYDALRRAINRTHYHALRLAAIDKHNLTHNSLLHELDGAAYPEKHRPYTANTISQAIVGGAPLRLSDADQLSAVNLVKQNRTALATRHPEQLMQLQRDIEFVTLERLIEKFEALMAKDTVEERWQNLLVENPFILSLAFGLPVVALGDQVSVGGRTFSGAGEKITDFLVKNGHIDNLALIEIKTARTKLLGREYRGGVFPPSAELTGCLTQVLDQRHRLQAELSARKVNSRRYDLEAYAVRCVVIIGKTPDEVDQKKSLELFRNNLHDILIITFDELLEKLRDLHKFLSPER